jgi:hypothetical protein
MNAKDNSRRTTPARIIIITALLMIALALVILFMAACTPKQSVQKPDKGNDTIIVLSEDNQTNVIVIINDSREIDLSNLSSSGSNLPEETPADVQEQPERNNTFVNASSTQRSSEVEFYFLLTGKFYFKAIQKENEAKAYNASGELVTVQPIFISKDKVIFKVNNYTTKAIAEKEWGAAPDSEIFVNAIYYRN